MKTKRDYYEILGVNRDADAAAIKSQYRKLAMQYHPDRNPGDKSAEDKFKESAEAYEVLSDLEKRRIYDQYGHDGLNSAGFSGARGFEDIFSSFGDIFEDFFGFGSKSRTRGGNGRGADLRYDMELDFMEAAFGVEKEIKLEKQQTCSKCDGTGCAPGTFLETCTTCRGSGHFTQTQGFFSIRTTCPKCNGGGRIIPSPCMNCRGRGLELSAKSVSVKIPAGVDSGSRLRLTGEGEGGVKGGPSGDLYVVLHVKPHDFFSRDGVDILCQIPISFIDATLGASIDVPTLTGKEVFNIPKGTQPGEVLRLKGLGLPSLRGYGKGDMVVHLDIKTPTGLSKKQESLLREFSELDSKKLSSKIKKIFN
ncbi:MAG: molecular chaperone DnaJ [Pseudomonadota bacterium]